MPFQKALVEKETSKTSSEIWTWFIDSISCNNDYATCVNNKDYATCVNNKAYATCVNNEDYSTYVNNEDYFMCK